MERGKMCQKCRSHVGVLRTTINGTQQGKVYGLGRLFQTYQMEYSKSRIPFFTHDSEG